MNVQILTQAQKKMASMNAWSGASAVSQAKELEVQSFQKIVRCEQSDTLGEIVEHVGI